MTTCANMRMSCQGDVDECQQANRCLLDPGTKPDPTIEDILAKPPEDRTVDDWSALVELHIRQGKVF